MQSLTDIHTANNAAVAREWEVLVRSIHELENILGLPESQPTSWAQARRRLQNLRSVAASRLDPDDPETQYQPIYYGQWLERMGG